MVSSIVTFFVVINLYICAVAHMVRMLRSHHGTLKGFVISNAIILGAFVLALLVAYQIYIP